MECKIVDDFFVLIADHHTIASEFHGAAGEIGVFVPVYECRKDNKVYAVL